MAIQEVSEARITSVNAGGALGGVVWMAGLATGGFTSASDGVAKSVRAAAVAGACETLGEAVGAEDWVGADVTEETGIGVGAVVAGCDAAANWLRR